MKRAHPATVIAVSALDRSPQVRSRSDAAEKLVEPVGDLTPAGVTVVLRRSPEFSDSRAYGRECVVVVAHSLNARRLNDCRALPRECDPWPSRAAARAPG